MSLDITSHVILNCPNPFPKSPQAITLFFTNLSEEILLLILCYFSTDLFTLCDLAGSNRRFNDLATPFFCHDIELGQNYSTVSSSFPTRLGRLVRAVNEKLNVAPLLLRLRLM